MTRCQPPGAQSNVTLDGPSNHSPQRSSLSRTNCPLFGFSSRRLISQRFKLPRKQEGRSTPGSPESKLRLRQRQKTPKCLQATPRPSRQISSYSTAHVLHHLLSIPSRSPSVPRAKSPSSVKSAGRRLLGKEPLNITSVLIWVKGPSSSAGAYTIPNRVFAGCCHSRRAFLLPHSLTSHL